MGTSRFRALRLRRVLAGALVLCAAGEIGARVWDQFQGPTGSLYDFIVPAGNRFKLRADTAVTVPERYGDIVYRFNHEGYRDADHDPRERRQRIVWLGDSVSFGLGVAQDRTFVGRLQKELASQSPPYDLVNLSIFAYHTGNELDALREDGLKYRPGLVVVQFYMNDFATPGAAAPPAPPSVSDRLTAVKNRFVYKSALYRRLNEAVGRLGYVCFHDLRRRHFPETLNDNEPRGDRERLLANPDDRSIAAFAALLGIRDTAARAGARLFVFISPDEVQLFTRRYDLVNERFARFCRANRIDSFDPLPQLRASPQRVSLFYDGVHYSAAGHALMARLLSTALHQRSRMAADGE
jgi:lysophospholipase L1-like esterase